ncbi:MAG: MBL fold metallo-hydrolase [Chloroflexota bacterium]
MTQATSNPIRIELPTPFAVGPVNSYLFIEPEPVLIDTGVDTEDSWNALVDGLKANGLTVADLKRIVITHGHVDHFGQAYKLLEQSQANVWVADIGADWMLRPRQKFQNRLDYYAEYFLPATGVTEEMLKVFVNYIALVRDASTPLPAERVVQFKVGEMLDLGGLPWEVVHMPGHASHQTCFYQLETKQFISADMLLPITPTPIVEFPKDGKMRQPALPVFIDSLAKVEAMTIESVYPGHGDIFHNPNELIARQRQRIHMRKDQCFELVQDGVDTAVALLDIMYAKYHPGLRSAGLWMLIGYLDLLIAEDKVKEELDGKIIRYKVK